jgi:arylsulfatase A-like enzyme
LLQFLFRMNWQDRPTSTILFPVSRYSFLDGYSLLPVIGASSHDRLDRRPPHVAAMAACDSLNAGQFMLRQGKWKLITYATAASPRAFPPQLFDLEADMWEMHDVAASNPAIVSSMDATLRELTSSYLDDAFTRVRQCCRAHHTPTLPPALRWARAIQSDF